MKTGFITLFISSLICSSVFAHDRGGTGGGMDGGGGGTLPADPSSIYEVRKVAELSRPALYFLFNGMQRYFWRDEIKQKLYGGAQTVQDVLARVRLEVREDQPCYDRFGNEVDASIFGAKPNTICLSASRIAPKVSKANVESEVIALLGHEVSHFLGTNEAEAQELQKTLRRALLEDSFALKKINSVVFNMIHVDFDIQTESPLRSAVNKLEETIPDLNEAIEKLYLAMTGIIGLRGWREKHFGPARFFEFWEKSDLDLLDLLSQEVRLAHAYLDKDTQSKTSTWSREMYEEAFGVRDFVTLKELLSFIDDSHRYKSSRIQKFESTKHVLERMKAVQIQLRLIGRTLFDTSRGMNWMPRSEREKVFNLNPWSALAGRYLVQSSTCSWDGDLKELHLEAESKISIKEKLIGQNGWNENHIALGWHHYSLRTESISSGLDYVQFQTRFGGNWENRQPHIDNTQIWTFTLKKISEAQYEYHRKSELLVRDMSQPDKSESCVIHLTKQ